MKINPIIEVEYSLPAFLQAIAKLGPQEAYRVLRSYSAGLMAIADLYANKWKSYASGAPIPGTNRRIHSTGPYRDSIKTESKDPFTKRVYTDYEWASLIEQGKQETDLKPGLLRGRKARAAKGGWAYNIVSFRHGTKHTERNPMSPNIFNQISKLFQMAREQGMQDISSIVSRGGGKLVHHPETGYLRQLNVYSWGMRTGETGPIRTSSKGYTWKTGKQSGIVHMKGGQWRTFRTVSAKSASNSWISPAIPGIPIRNIVVEQMQKSKIPDRILSEALEKDFGAGGEQVEIK